MHDPFRIHKVENYIFSSKNWQFHPNLKLSKKNHRLSNILDLIFRLMSTSSRHQEFMVQLYKSFIYLCSHHTSKYGQNIFSSVHYQPTYALYNTDIKRPCAKCLQIRKNMYFTWFVQNQHKGLNQSSQGSFGSSSGGTCRYLGLANGCHGQTRR
jgi:hypothetical protein